MAIGNFIQNGLGQVWNRRTRAWINPEEMTESKLMSDCAYPTFTGCNRMAYQISKLPVCDKLWPKKWGRLHIRHKPS